MQQITKNTVYDITWQALRVSLLGKWVTRLGTEENIKKLRLYIEVEPSVSKTWRTLNLLNGTRMGFHAMHLVGSEMDKALMQFRTEVQYIYQQQLQARMEFEEITEEQMRKDWRELDLPTQNKILMDLQKRLAAHQESKEREDLRWAIKIMLDEHDQYLTRRVDKMFKDDIHD